MSKYIAISDARANLPNLVENVNASHDEVIITVYGKPLAKLVPAESDSGVKETNYKEIVEKSFGILPDFPDVTKARVSRKKSIKL